MSVLHGGIMKSISVRAGVFALIIFFNGTVSAQYLIKHGTFGSGGNRSEGSSVILESTLGQTIIGSSQGPNLSLASGFWFAVHSGSITSVEQNNDGIPLEFRLEQNYPNPFNPATTIRFALHERQQVSLIVYDLLGRTIATLVDELLDAGEYSAVFDAKGIASGIYIYRIHAGSSVKTRRMLLLK
jgi:hypothetical protein